MTLNKTISADLLASVSGGCGCTEKKDNYFFQKQENAQKDADLHETNDSIEELKSLLVYGKCC